MQGATREVVVIGERMHDNVGQVIGTQGFYIDVTPTGETQAAIITEAVAEIAENRAAIERAKGILMLVYRIQSDAAFDLLKWRSQETNVKLRVLAEQLIADVRALEYDEIVPPRSTFDRLLLTAHQRIRAKAAARKPRVEDEPDRGERLGLRSAERQRLPGLERVHRELVSGSLATLNLIEGASFRS